MSATANRRELNRMVTGGRGSGMEVRDIKALIALMRDNGLIELEVEDKKGKIRLVRAADLAAEAPPRPAQLAARQSPPRTPSAPSGAATLELADNQSLLRS